MSQKQQENEAAAEVAAMQADSPTPTPPGNHGDLAAGLSMLVVNFLSDLPGLLRLFVLFPSHNNRR